MICPSFLGPELSPNLANDRHLLLIREQWFQDAPVKLADLRDREASGGSDTGIHFRLLLKPFARVANIREYNSWDPSFIGVPISPPIISLDF